MADTLRDSVSDYLESSHFALLQGAAKPYAEPLLQFAATHLDAQCPQGPETVTATVVQTLLLDQVARLEVPLTARQAAPELLGAFFDYLGTSGRCPPAAAWSTWIDAITARYQGRFRDDGSVRGETVSHRLPSVGRNDPCPCGSGLKYKKCCMALLG
jgi:hypothetical protein